MGNTVSGSNKDRHIDECVDFGALVPQGVYTGPQDWNQQIVGHLIVDRKLAPFYRPLEEYDEQWDDERILAARKHLPNAPAPPPPPDPAPRSHRHASKAGKEPFRPTEASVYRGAVECPICFLYYPPNINRSRCCDQAICTECFVQLKRAEPTTTHLVSEPASCPYCVQDNFGVTYDPPPWRTGLVREGLPAAAARPPAQKTNSGTSSESRRKSFSADSAEVVTIDQIRPDWEAKLAAVRAAVTRRANRRIIMRQVGDRLIPIGVTSGRDEEGRRRRAHGQDLGQLLGSVGLGGQDLEELMVMEAMRLSLVEHEAQQRRANDESSGSTNAANGNGNEDAGNASSPSSSPAATPRTPSPAASPRRSRFYVAPSPLGNGDGEGVTPQNDVAHEDATTAQTAHEDTTTPAETACDDSAPQTTHDDTATALQTPHDDPAPAPQTADDNTATTPPTVHTTAPQTAHLFNATPDAETTDTTADNTTPDNAPPALPTHRRSDSTTGARQSSSGLPESVDPIAHAPETAGVVEGRAEVEVEGTGAGVDTPPSSSTPVLATGYAPLPSSTEASDPLLGWEGTREGAEGKGEGGASL